MRIDFKIQKKVKINTIGIYIVGLLWLQVTIAYGQKTDSSKAEVKDRYIQNMTDLSSYKLSITNDIVVFSVDADNYFVKLYPNTATSLKLSFNYRFLSFTITHAPSFLPNNKDDKLKGKTKNFGLGFGLMHPHWFTHVSYSKNKGYYLENTRDFSANWQQGDPYIQFPELEVNSFEAIGGYSFNENFSVRALTTQTERQLQSAGSFIPMAAVRLYYVNNLQNTSGQKSRNLELIAGAGYHYTLVLKQNFYISAGITPGAGFIFTELTTRGNQGSPDDIITNSKSPVARIEGRGALGYNGKKFFAGAQVDIRGTWHEQENTTVINSDTHTFYQIFFGLRFPAPKVLNKLMDKVPYMN